ncbi:aldose 1-epimerase family protein [soil metagenome]
MPCPSRFKRPEHLDQDLITLTSGLLTAQINPLGAELWSLADAQERALMTDADPRWWTGHAPLLFPFVGKLRNDSYRVNGENYTLPQHGFARKHRFALVESDAASALFRLGSDWTTMENYPFELQLDMHFVLVGATLAMTATVRNLDDTDMPFSLGYHPAFAWPLPYGGRAEDHRIIFEKPEPAPIRRIGDEPGLIAPDRIPSPVDGTVLTPTHAMFAGDALIWDNLESRSLTWGVPGTPSLKVDFPDTPWLGIWQKPGAHYLCIEPWAGMADPAGFEGDVWSKPGVIRLPPGEERSFRMDVTLTQS